MYELNPEGVIRQKNMFMYLKLRCVWEDVLVIKYKMTLEGNIGFIYCHLSLQHSLGVLTCTNKVQYHELSGGGKKLDLGSRKILI